MLIIAFVLLVGFFFGLGMWIGFLLGQDRERAKNNDSVSLKKVIEKLRGALRPFAERGIKVDPQWEDRATLKTPHTVGAYRRARSAYDETQG